MKTKPVINNYLDLVKYERQISAELDQEIEEFKTEFDNLKNNFSPTAFAVNSVGKLMNNDKSMGIVNNFVGDGVGFLLKNVLFRKSGLITRLAVPLIAKAPITNFISKIIKDKAPSILGTLAGKIFPIMESKKEPLKKIKMKKRPKTIE